MEGSPPRRGSVARVFTAIYYPNVGWEDDTAGGELRIWPEGSYEAIEIPPKGDRLVVFIANMSHEVLPVKAASGSGSVAQRRCAFTQWFSAVVPDDE